MPENLCSKCSKSLFFIEDLNYKVCPRCKSIINEQFFLDPIYKFIELGFKLISDSNYESLYELGDIIVANYPNNFFGYAFKFAADMKLDIFKDIPKLSYQLNKKEMQDDLKSRIYHEARWKYITCTDVTYNPLCKHYPDRPGSKRGKWDKAITKFENKRDNLIKQISLIESAMKKYLRDMELYASNHDEINIVHNIKLYYEYLKHGLKDLADYEKEAKEFVSLDYKMTPKPGNGPLFSLNLAFLIVSLIILTISIIQSIFYLNIKPETIYILNAVLSISSSVLFSVALIVLIIKLKLFKDGKWMLGFFVSLLGTGFIASNILSTFINNIGIWFYVINFVIGAIFNVIALVNIKKYKVNNTYKNGTYIGNYKALVNNDFVVKFIYTYKHFEGEEEKNISSKEEILSFYK